MSETPKIKFPELLQLKLPRGTNAALDELAKRQHRTKSDIARQALLHALALNDLRRCRADPGTRCRWHLELQHERAAWGMPSFTSSSNLVGLISM
jgi:hypothetical protein